jgi:hypothetical protein
MVWFESRRAKRRRGALTDALTGGPPRTLGETGPNSLASHQRERAASSPKTCSAPCEGLNH